MNDKTLRAKRDPLHTQIHTLTQTIT